MSSVTVPGVSKEAWDSWWSTLDGFAEHLGWETVRTLTGITVRDGVEHHRGVTVRFIESGVHLTVWCLPRVTAVGHVEAVIMSTNPAVVMQSVASMLYLVGL